MTKPCQRCTCQALGHIRPRCVRGLIGARDPETGEWAFAPLPCEFDAVRLLAGIQHAPQDPPTRRMGKRCADCGRPISDHADARCSACAAKVNGAQSKGGPPNPQWAYPAKSGRR